VAAVALLALVLAACSGGTKPTKPSHTSTSSGARPSSSATKSEAGGTAVFAEAPQAAPNYIFPMVDPAGFNTANIGGFVALMYRPLYWFGKGSSPTINYALSLAYPPSFSHNNTTATIRLKPYRWSNGQPVSASNVAFWQHMVTVEKKNWIPYVPGNYPDNVRSVTVTGTRTIVFHLTHPVAPTWFTYNELSQVTPMPSAWDRTGNGPSHCTTTPSDCAAVYNYLTSLAKRTDSYDSTPIWKIVDGPWKLRSFSTNGRVVLVPNRSYSGPVKPKLSRFIEEPFTSDTAEYNALRAGTLDVGYVPPQDLAHDQALTAQHYTVKPWFSYGMTFYELNRHNPTAGAIFNQLYLRQALEYLIDQPAAIKVFYGGAAVRSCGPVPLYPKSPFLDAYEKRCPYHYDPAKARRLLTQHGWRIPGGGAPAVCRRPGSGASDCGPGVRAGATLDFSVQYSAGITALDNLWASYKSTASQVGIVFNLHSAPFATVLSNVVPCTPRQAICKWQIADTNGWTYGPDYAPTGGELFSTGAGSNVGGYSSPTADRLINITHEGKDFIPAMKAYENYITKQLPVIWLPSPAIQITAIRPGLHGVLPQSAFLFLNPENWYRSRSS
jgi:peptide/nickel transport system substrate-binding protein